MEELSQLNKRDENGRSALHSACQKGHIDCVKELLKAGAELNITDIEGNTALMHTVFGGHVDCANELIKAGPGFELQK